MVQIIDPNTGDVREAGSFSKYEWTKLTREQPDLATLLLQLRREEEAAIDAQARADAAIALGLGTATAGIAAPNIYSQMPALGNAFARSWIENTYQVPDTVIYDGPRMQVRVDGDIPKVGHQLNLWVDGSTEPPYEPVFRQEDLLNKQGQPLTEEQASWRKPRLIREGKFEKQYKPVPNPKELIPEIHDAKIALEGHITTPEGQRLYMAFPDDVGAFGGEKVDRLTKLGFKPSSIGGHPMFIRDARPGAKYLGKGYHLIDQVVQGPIGRRPLRYAGTLAGALGLGALVAGGVDLVQDNLG